MARRTRGVRGVFGALALLLLAGGAWLAWALQDRPDPASFGVPELPPAAKAPATDGASAGSLRMTFLGVSTVLLDDGETAILTDGFFSRPGLVKTLAGRVGPDEAAIEATLRRFDIERLAAVVVVHSHYDHSMDAPEVARRTGALLVGSESTAQVGRGQDLPESRIRVVRGGETLALGRFRVTLIPSRHVPHGMAMGEIEAPLEPPARATAYKEGGSFSVHVAHAGRALLVQGSAGFVEGALADHPAEVVLLGVGLLASQPAAYQETYWREVVGRVGARRVIPIHWDDFSRPLGEPLRPFPRLLDDLGASLRFLRRRAEAEGVEVRLAPPFAPVDPFAGLGPPPPRAATSPGA